MLQRHDRVKRIGGDQEILPGGQQPGALGDGGSCSQRHPGTMGDQLLNRLCDLVFFAVGDRETGQIPDIFGLLAQPGDAIAALHQRGLVQIAQIGADRLHRNLEALAQLLR